MGEILTEGRITASFPLLSSTQKEMLRASRTRSEIQETREETACIEITRTVKGYQEC